MSYLGNVVGGDIVRYINLPISELKVGGLVGGLVAQYGGMDFGDCVVRDQI